MKNEIVFYFPSKVPQIEQGSIALFRNALTAKYAFMNPDRSYFDLDGDGTGIYVIPVGKVVINDYTCEEMCVIRATSDQTWINFSPEATESSGGGGGGVGPQGPQGSQGTPGGSQGAQGATGSQGLTGPQGTSGPQGNGGAQGGIGLTGPQGSAGGLGPQGNPGVQGPAGAQGAGGPQGAAGAQGATGTQGASGPQGAAINAQYVQLGSQPGTIAATQPFTYTTDVLLDPGIIKSTSGGGSVFELVAIGRYEVNFQMTYPTDGGVVVYAGPTTGSMLPLDYTMTGKTPDGQISNSVIVETTTVSSFISINAAAGNAAAIAIPPNSSTTNMSATTVSIKKIS